jgi:hypothetical protein
MHDHVRVLCWHPRVSNNVADRDEFAVMASHTAVRRELARPECRDKGRRTSDSSIAISRIRCYKFIRVAFPVQPIVGYKVQQCKLVVYTILINSEEL